MHTLKLQSVRFICYLTQRGNSQVEQTSPSLRWLGHVLRMEQDHISKVALRWTPPGKRKPGRPKTTWRRTVTQELEQMNLSWGEAQHAARDRMQWRSLIEALCPIGDEEE